MRTIAVVTLFALLGLGAACGSDGSGSVEACRQTLTKLCDRACGCTDGEACDLYYQGVTMQFDTRQECLDWYVETGCRSSDLPEVAFFDTCSAALDQAACLEEEEGALIMPEDCIYSEGG
ncbi:MAG: hypothetical protein JXR96_03595 [Deltaproteobacteria bacterium]|nr:hypothetical protein [Deltaproteobacteria bacterium]